MKLDATERRALTATTFSAACVCFAPAEIISGVVLLVAAFLLYRWDQRLLRQEAAAAGAAAPPPPAPAADAGAGAG
jgi:hypothetical protein